MCPYNVVPQIGPDVAVVAVEPIAANMGLVAPDAGFLAGLRAACDRVGALLLFDEVITGFRIGNGGASVWSGVTPDLWCFAKVIGGGLPVGAFAGPRAIMEHVAPVGPVYQGGTLSGNPLAVAAGRAVLEELTDDAFVQLGAAAQRLAKGLQGAITDAGFAVQVPVLGPLLGVFFSPTPVHDYAQAKIANGSDLFARFFHAMLRRGIALAPGAYEVLFPSLAHTDALIDQTIEMAAAAAKEMAAAGP